MNLWMRIAWTISITALLGACKTTDRSKLQDTAPNPAENLVSDLVFDALSKTDADAALVLQKVQDFWNSGNDANASASMIFFIGHAASFDDKAKIFCDKAIATSAASLTAERCLQVYALKRLPPPELPLSKMPSWAWAKWKSDPAHDSSDQILPNVEQLSAIPDMQKSMLLARILMSSPADFPKIPMTAMVKTGLALIPDDQEGALAAKKALLALAMMQQTFARTASPADYSFLAETLFESLRTKQLKVEAFVEPSLPALKSMALVPSDATSTELSLSIAVPIAVQREFAALLNLKFQNEDKAWLGIWSDIVANSENMIRNGSGIYVPIILNLSPLTHQEAGIFAAHSIATYKDASIANPYQTIAKSVQALSTQLRSIYPQMGCDANPSTSFRICPPLAEIYKKFLVPTIMSLTVELANQGGMAACPLPKVNMDNTACRIISVLDFLGDANAIVGIFEASKNIDTPVVNILASAVSRVKFESLSLFEPNLYFNMTGTQGSQRTVAMDYLCYAAATNYLGGPYDDRGVPEKFLNSLFLFSRLVFAVNAKNPNDSSDFNNRWARVPSDTSYCDDDLAFDRPANFMTKRIKEYALDLGYFFPINRMN